MITTLKKKKKKKKKKKTRSRIITQYESENNGKKGGMPSPLKTSMSTAHGKISWKNQGK
jgi:hypothetical protein